MKILLVDDEEENRELMSFVLESGFNARVIEAESGNRAIQIIDNEKDIDIIICDYNMKNGTGGDVFRHLNTISSKIPYVLCSSERIESHLEFKDSSRLSGYLEKPVTPEMLVDEISRVLVIGRKIAMPDYFRVKLRNLCKGSRLRCDLYLSLSGGKFVKVANQGDLFGKDDLDRYEARKINHLYIKREDCQAFLGDCRSEIQRLFQDESLLEESCEISRKTLDVIKETTRQMGFTKEAQELTKSCVELTLRSIRRTPKIAAIIERLNLERDNYITSHSVLLSYVTCGIASAMTWVSDVTFYKLCLASMLHDLTLVNEALARVEEPVLLLSEGDSRFSYDEVVSFENHPKNAADLVGEMNDIPSGVDVIVIQHHERPDGSGFPRGLDHTKISNLSSLFIIAEDLVNFIWDRQGKWEMREFIGSAAARYKRGIFKDLLGALALSQGEGGR